MIVQTRKGHAVQIDPPDAALFRAHPWEVDSHGQLWHRAYAHGRTLRSSFARTLLGLPPGDPRLVNYRNGDRLDCRRANLRIATAAQRATDHGLSRRNTHGLKGIVFHKHTGKWAAQIRADGVQLYLGLHPTPTEAAAAYDDAARRLHGPFARPNFPQADDAPRPTADASPAPPREGDARAS